MVIVKSWDDNKVVVLGGNGNVYVDYDVIYANTELIAKYDSHQRAKEVLEGFF